ncbi:Glucose-repressible protein [Lachnellula suecica]|uniref:Glucose-repressible protein n=1 Tax=Lachnellula suecica TaxID=602035 RepID=A0A8T9C497_9HELO|nr:Glucose-repressible protein [Lachnellula suecica]
METIKASSSLSSSPRTLNAANYVSESVQGTGAEASKEANKSVAKDNDASLSSRATAAKDAVVDKKDETSHNTKADVHKESAKH